MCRWRAPPLGCKTLACKYVGDVGIRHVL
jgi:hypothetical protein